MGDSTKEGPLLFRNKSDDWEKVNLSVEHGILTILKGEFDVLLAVPISNETQVEGPLVEGSTVSFEVISGKHTLEFADASSKPIQEWIKFLNQIIQERANDTPRSASNWAGDAMIGSLPEVPPLPVIDGQINLSKMLTPRSPRSDEPESPQEGASPKSARDRPTRDKSTKPRTPRGSTDAVKLAKESSKTLDIKSSDVKISRDKGSSASKTEGMKHSGSSSSIKAKLTPPPSRVNKSLKREGSSTDDKVSHSHEDRSAEEPQPKPYNPKSCWLGKQVNAALSAPTSLLPSLNRNPMDTRISADKFNDKIHVWNMTQGLCERIFSGHTSQINDFVCFGPINDPLVLSSSEKETLLWKALTGEVLTDFPDVLVSFALGDPKSRWRVIVATQTNLESWLFSSGQTKPVITQFEGHKNKITCLACHPDAGTLVSSSLDNTIKIWNIESQQCEMNLENDSGVHNFTLLPGNVIVAFETNGNYSIWQLDPFQKVLFQSSLSKPEDFKIAQLPSTFTIQGNSLKSTATKNGFSYQFDSQETLLKHSGKDILVVKQGDSVICFVGEKDTD